MVVLDRFYCISLFIFHDCYFSLILCFMIARVCICVHVYLNVDLIFIILEKECLSCKHVNMVIHNDALF